jgi:hypothetical protein
MFQFFIKLDGIAESTFEKSPKLSNTESAEKF